MSPSSRPTISATLAAFVPPDTEVLLSYEGRGTLNVAGKERAALVIALASANSRQMGLHLWRGRLFTPEELQHGARVAVIGRKLAAELTAGRPTESAIGAELTCQGQAVRVIGIQEAVVGDRPYLSVVVPLGGAEALMAAPATPRARTLALNAARVEDVMATKATAEAWADRRNPDWRTKNQVSIASTGLDRLIAMNQGILIFKIDGRVHGHLAHCRRHRHHERAAGVGGGADQGDWRGKAAGARRRDIIVQFLAESVVISLAGAVIGAILGIAGPIRHVHHAGPDDGAGVRCGDVADPGRGDGSRHPGGTRLRPLPGAQGREPLAGRGDAVRVGARYQALGVAGLVVKLIHRLAAAGRPTGHRRYNARRERSCRWRGDAAGPYEILGLIGAGGMGEVYRARDIRLGRLAALKVIRGDWAANPERQRRFIREAQSASALNHPNILTIYEIGTAGGLDYIAMEDVAGGTLADILREGPVGQDRALRIAAQVADGPRPRTRRPSSIATSSRRTSWWGQAIA